MTDVLQQLLAYIQEFHVTGQVIQLSMDAFCQLIYVEGSPGVTLFKMRYVLKILCVWCFMAVVAEGGWGNYYLGTHLGYMSICWSRGRNIFWENLNPSHSHSFGPPPGKGGMASFQKIYFKPIYPLLVECQAFNSTLKLQQRILIFFFFLCQTLLTLYSLVSQSSQEFISINNIHERYMIHRLV